MKVTYMYTSSPNSAGGVGVSMVISNNSEKEVKYVYFDVTPINAVDDEVICEVSRKSHATLQITGPLKAWAVQTPSWDCVWYNSTIKNLSLYSVEVIYMDGTKETLTGKEAYQPNLDSGSGGCYVATCVYGSYDCPQVWTLRRYRDESLAKHWYGRAFIRAYYAISPTAVKLFGKTSWFKKLWKNKLDKMVKKLQDSGVESTPYNDIDW